jgi:hypothetical protein
VDGCKSSKGFKVKYTLGGVNVTDQVVSGDFISELLEPGDRFDLRAKIKVKRNAEVGKKKKCKIVGNIEGADGNSDAILAKLKVKRS